MKKQSKVVFHKVLMVLVEAAQRAAATKTINTPRTTPNRMGSGDKIANSPLRRPLGRQHRGLKLAIGASCLFTLIEHVHRNHKAGLHPIECGCQCPNFILGSLIKLRLQIPQANGLSR